MIKFLIAALTSLFVSFMPLQAAWAQGTDGRVSAGCVSIEMVVNPGQLEALDIQGGFHFVLKGQKVTTFLKHVEELVGSEAPFVPDTVVIAKPAQDADVYNVIWFADNCLLNHGKLPTPFIETLFPRS